MNIKCTNVLKFVSMPGAKHSQAIEETIAVCTFLTVEAELIVDDITLYLNPQSELGKCVQTYLLIKSKRR